VKEGFYPNPNFQIKKQPPVLCVIAVFIPEGRIAEYNLRCADGRYEKYKHDRLECLKFVLRCYEFFNAGVDYDLILIDNSSPDREAQKFLSNCSYTVLKRENTFFSFGPRKFAWEKFGDKYDYYFFQELDWIPIKDNWLLEMIKILLSDRAIGSVGNNVERRSWTENPFNPQQKVNNEFIEKIAPHRKQMYNLHGAYCLIPSRVLKEIDSHGGFLMFPCKPQTELDPVYNELAFHQPILEMGYKIRSFDDGEHILFRGIHYEKGINENLPDECFAPLVPEQTRFFSARVKDYLKKKRIL